MTNLDCKVLEALDTLNEVACVVSTIGTTVSTTPLGQDDRTGATLILDWSVQRLRDSLSVLGTAIRQDGNAPN